MTTRKQDIPRRADATDEILREDGEEMTGARKKVYTSPSLTTQGTLSIHAGSLNLWGGP
ncbi:hypothetical protein [Rhodocaloribacter sp.]